MTTRKNSQYSECSSRGIVVAARIEMLLLAVSVVVVVVVVAVVIVLMVVVHKVMTDRGQ